MKIPLFKSISWQDLWTKEKEAGRAVWNFLKSLWNKIRQDNILFLASGMSFNMLLCLIPILLLWIYIFGILFQSADTIQFLDRILITAFPNQPHALTIRQSISSVLEEIVTHRKSFGLLSTAVLLATSASLFSSARSVLNQVFALSDKRHFLISYLVDLALVLGLTLLIIFTASLSLAYRTFQQFRKFIPYLSDLDHYGIWGGATDLLSWIAILVLCYLLYRYIPSERIEHRIAWISAAVTSFIWEISGRLFAWYLTTLTPFSKIYGTYAFILVLMVWVFYSSIIFILGAEIGELIRERTPSKSEGPS